MHYIWIMSKPESVQQRVWADTVKILRRLSKAMRISVPSIIHHAVLDYRDRYEDEKRGARRVER